MKWVCLEKAYLEGLQFSVLPLWPVWQKAWMAVFLNRRAPHADLGSRSSEKSTTLAGLTSSHPLHCEVMNSSVPGVGSLSRQLELVSRACVFEVVGGGTLLNIKDGVKPRGRASSSDTL
jgi:hypothetical protein